MRHVKRRFLMGSFALVTVPLLAASAAYACQRLVTLHANPTTAAAGATVQVTGVNYDRNATSSAVDIRLDRRSGPVLASVPTASLGSKGDFAVAVTIPAGTAIGNHILVATQTLGNGAPCVGCPGRANLEVTSGATAASAGPAAAGPSSNSEDSSTQPASGSSSAPASQPDSQASQPASEPATASQYSGTEAPAPALAPAPASGTTATDATPPASAVSAARPVASATSGDAGQVAPPSGPVDPAAPALATSDALGASGASAAVDPAPVTPGPAPVALVPAAAGERPTVVPGLALATGLALVLLGLGAFWKSRMTMFGGRSFTLAG